MSELLPNDLPRSPVPESGPAAGAPPAPRPLPRPGIDPAAALAANRVAMLGTARRASICEDDAQDAVQAAAERFLRNVHRVDPETVTGWLVTVAKNEALRVRERRVRTGTIDDDDRRLVHPGDGPEDLAAREEEIELAREALARLKKHERLALWMQAEGRSYDEIAEELSWTRTKVNRNLTEGRARLRRALSEIAMGEGCGVAGPRIDRLAVGDASAEDLRELRPHLRRCAACRGRLRRARGARWGVVPPILLAWLPWAGRGTGTPPPVRARVTELVADRLALVLPATSGAVTEAGLAVTTGLAVAALGAGVLTAGSAAEDPPARTAQAPVTAVVRPASAPAAPAVTVAPAPIAPVASARTTLASATAVTGAALVRAERAAARRRADARERRRAVERRRARARRAAELRRAAARRRTAAARSASAAPAPAAAVGSGTTAADSAALAAPSPSPASTGGSGAPSGGSGGGAGGGGSAASEFGFE